MILVDTLLVWPNARGIFKKGSCHLISTDGPDELHRFAAKLGLERSWFQNTHNGRCPHYDLTAGKRRYAVIAGALEVSCKDALLRNYGYTPIRRST